MCFCNYFFHKHIKKKHYKIIYILYIVTLAQNCNKKFNHYSIITIIYKYQNHYNIMTWHMYVHMCT